MKRILICCLLAALLAGLTACGAAVPQPEPSTLPAETVSQTQPETQSVTETLPPIPEGSLYLSVSEITLTLQGDREDIYLGTLPREFVVWGTEDETIATFDEGILTATGVGTTTAYAQCGEQLLTCTVNCLADSEESLSQLDKALLRMPKRLPPLITLENPHYYDGVAIVGDSITWIMAQWHDRCGGLGSPIFMCRGGTGINGIVLGYKPVPYNGIQMPIEDGLHLSGAEKVFIMLGVSDLGYLSIDETMEKWEALLTLIRSKNPDIQVYFQSVLPEWTGDFAFSEKNDKIAAHNLRLKEFAETEGCFYVDIAAYVEDHRGRMATVYSMDNSTHLNDTGNVIWAQALNAYAEYQHLLGLW